MNDDDYRDILRRVTNMSHNIRRRFEFNFELNPIPVPIHSPEVLNIIDSVNQSILNSFNSTMSTRSNVDILSVLNTTPYEEPFQEMSSLLATQVFDISQLLQRINSDYNFEDDRVEFEDVKILLNQEEFEKTIKIKNKEITCGICTETKEHGVSTKCNHDFCKDCLQEWLTKYNVKCPICRSDTRIL